MLTESRNGAGRITQSPDLVASAGRQENDVAGFENISPMPSAPGNDDRIPGLNICVRILAVQKNQPQFTGNKVKNLVSVGVHFSAVRRILRHIGNTEYQTVH